MLSRTMASLSGLCHDATAFPSLAFFNHSICRCPRCTAPFLKLAGQQNPLESLSNHSSLGPTPPRVRVGTSGRRPGICISDVSLGEACAPVPTITSPSPTFPQLACRKCCHIHLECHLLGNSAHTVSKPQW